MSIKTEISYIWRTEGRDPGSTTVRKKHPDSGGRRSRKGIIHGKRGSVITQAQGGGIWE